MTEKGMSQAQNSRKDYRLQPGDFYFNEQGELVIRNAELIQAVRSQVNAGESGDVQGYAMPEDRSPEDWAVVIGVTRD
jgi:hypothetical protein